MKGRGKYCINSELLDILSLVAALTKSKYVLKDKMLSRVVKEKLLRATIIHYITQKQFWFLSLYNSRCDTSDIIPNLTEFILQINGETRR